MYSESDRFTSSEIDLFAIARHVWSQKLFIVGVMILTTAAAIIYTLTITPVYEARSIVQPPMQSDVSSLNYGRGDSSGLPLVTVKDIYDLFLGELQSQSARYEYFSIYVLPQLKGGEGDTFKAEQFAIFDRAMSISVVSREFPDKILVIFESPDPLYAVDLVEKFPRFVAVRVKQAVVRNIEGAARNKANNIERKILEGQEAALNQRADEIARLHEALVIAQSIGLDKAISHFGSGGSGGVSDSLTYMRGSKALTKEIENLELRKSDDPYIPNLRQQQVGMKFYRDLDINSDTFDVYRQDGNAIPPTRPIKSRVMIVLVFGGGVGLILGTGIALLRIPNRAHDLNKVKNTV